MKAKELRQKSKNELEMMLRENRAKLLQLQFDLASRKLKNTHQLSATKKEIARVLSIMKESK